MQANGTSPSHDSWRPSSRFSRFDQLEDSMACELRYGHRPACRGGKRQGRPFRVIGCVCPAPAVTSGAKAEVSERHAVALGVVGSPDLSEREAPCAVACFGLDQGTSGEPWRKWRNNSAAAASMAARWCQRGPAQDAPVGACQSGLVGSKPGG